MGTKLDEDRRLLARIRANPTGRIALKVGIGTLGALVVALGIILIPFPGPGWAIVILGLAIWAVEFPWARTLLTWTRNHVRAWTTWIGRQPLLARGALGLLGLAFVTGVVWGSVRVSLGIDLVHEARAWLDPD